MTHNTEDNSREHFVNQSRKIKVGQLNLQNSMKATSEARQIILDYNLELLMVQEPYSIAGQIKGFGMGTTNITIGNESPHERPMAGIIVNSKFEPLIRRRTQKSLS